MGLDPNDEARRAFETAARTPNAWLGYADLHKRVADKLWPDSFLASRGLGELIIAMGHAGQAIEILLKGILVSKRPALIADGKFARRFTTHDLPKLAVDAGVVLDDEATTLLNQLAAFVKWAGSYPLPVAFGKTGLAAIGPRIGLGSMDSTNDSSWPFVTGQTGNLHEGSRPRAAIFLSLFWIGKPGKADSPDRIVGHRCHDSQGN